MRLSEYIQTHINRPFEWGSNDCCTFVGNWVRIKTGRDYLTQHGPWRTARQAAKKLRDLNGLSFFLGENFTSIHPNKAQDGDIGMVGEVLCLFSGRHVALVGVNGIEFADRVSADSAWTYR